MAATSPFTIDVTHSFFIPTFIYVHVIRATEAVTGLNGLKARIAITEKDNIVYTSQTENHTLFRCNA